MDNKRLRLALHGEHKIKRKALEAAQAELIAMKSAVPAVDEKIKTAHHAVLTADKARKAAEGSVSRLKEKVSDLKQQVRFRNRPHGGAGRSCDAFEAQVGSGVQVGVHQQLAAKRIDQAAACQARIEKAVARLKQLKSELASPMTGQITSKDREDLKKLQVRTRDAENLLC